MTDVLTARQRSYCMSSVRSKNTGPERIVRKIIHSLGYRFRVHRADLPGTPDIVLPRLRKIVLVHGCFWHGHSCRHGKRKPSSNCEYWKNKIHRNRVRGKLNERKLKELGWSIFVIWECELKNRPKIENAIQTFLAM